MDRLNMRPTVEPTPPKEGLLLIYVDSADNKLKQKDENGIVIDLAASGGASTLNELADVVVTTPALDEILAYDGAKWVNIVLPITGGDVVGPASATNTAIAVNSGTTGKLLIDSKVLIDPDGRISPTGLDGSTYFGSGAGIVDDLSANWSTGFGFNVLNSSITAFGCTAMGYESQKANIAGSNNTTYGYKTGILHTGGGATYLGYNAGKSSTGSSNQTFVGSESGARSVNGFSNACFGASAGGGIISNGAGNTFLGTNSGFSGGGIHHNNIGVGYNVMRNVTTGSNNLIIAYDIDLPTPTTSNYLNIGDIITGDMSTKVVTMQKLELSNLPVFADEAAAITGSLAQDMVYMTSTGELRIKL